jgi:hypothetical protein
LGTRPIPPSGKKKTPVIPKAVTKEDANTTHRQSRWQRGLRRRFGRLVTGIVGSDPARGMDFVFVFLCCVARELCDELITSLKESYQVLIILRNLRCEAAKVLTGTIEPLMMMNDSHLLPCQVIYPRIRLMFSYHIFRSLSKRLPTNILFLPHGGGGVVLVNFSLIKEIEHYHVSKRTEKLSFYEK